MPSKHQPAIFEMRAPRSEILSAMRSAAAVVREIRPGARAGVCGENVSFVGDGNLPNSCFGIAGAGCAVGGVNFLKFFGSLTGFVDLRSLEKLLLLGRVATYCASSVGFTTCLV